MSYKLFGSGGVIVPLRFNYPTANCAPNISQPSFLDLRSPLLRFSCGFLELPKDSLDLLFSRPFDIFPAIGLGTRL